jgi:hypothetical protein
MCVCVCVCVCVCTLSTLNLVTLLLHATKCGLQQLRICWKFYRAIRGHTYQLQTGLQTLQICTHTNDCMYVHNIIERAIVHVCINFIMVLCAQSIYERTLKTVKGYNHFTCIVYSIILCTYQNLRQVLIADKKTHLIPFNTANSSFQMRCATKVQGVTQ